MHILRARFDCTWAILLAIALAVTSPALLFGQAATPAEEAPGPSRPPELEEIKQANPSFLVRADVDRGTRSYREGDQLRISVASEEDAYVYVLYKQVDGKIFQILPNSQQIDNRVKARQAV